MRLLTYKQLRTEKGITYSRTHLRRISDPASEWYQGFPLPIEVSPGRIGWIEEEVDEWLRSRPRRVPTARSVEAEHEEPPMGKVPTSTLEDYNTEPTDLSKEAWEFLTSLGTKH
jgi:predicted DNA-binding transcriptional regulator AlpA